MRLNETIRSYNKSAKRYVELKDDRDYFWRQEYQKFFKLLKAGKILDIGCGPGNDSLFFTKKGFDYIGIDASHVFLKIARKINPKAKFIMMDFNRLHFPKESFDGFWACASLMHARRDRIGKVLEGIRKIIKPRGIGFIVVKNREGGSKQEIIFDKRYQSRRYFAFYDLKEFKKILLKHGFQVLLAKKLDYESANRSWMSFFVKKI